MQRWDCRAAHSLGTPKSQVDPQRANERTVKVEAGCAFATFLQRIKAGFEN
jgi:hypothetical protein